LRSGVIFFCLYRVLWHTFNFSSLITLFDKVSLFLFLLRSEVLIIFLIRMLMIYTSSILLLFVHHFLMLSKGLTYLMAIISTLKFATTIHYILCHWHFWLIMVIIILTIHIWNFNSFYWCMYLVLDLLKFFLNMTWSTKNMRKIICNTASIVHLWQIILWLIIYIIWLCYIHWI